MIQAQRRKKQIIKTLVVGLLVIGVAGGIYYGVASYEDSVTQERDATQTKYNEVTSTTTTLKDRLAKSSESYAAYEKIVRYNKAGDFTLNRKAVATLLEALKILHPVSNLQVNISPVKEVTTDVGKTKTGKIIYSEVKVQFFSPTDTIAFDFIKDLANQFPGLALYQSVNLKKTAELSTGVFQDLANNRLPVLVSGELNFNWYGLKPNEKTTTAGPLQ